MTRPSFDVASELQRHGDALRALAGVLVRDPNAADDAVQEVWLAALQRPPRHHESLGGWLAAALHNVLRMGRRGERRRAEREDVVRAACGGGDRGAGGDWVAREERGRQLLTAVESLEPPFRDAIWQRFFEGKAPREIAAASGVPIATVKSRLQRGLGMLRARLGEKDGADWRAGFAAAFGFGKEGAAAAGVAVAAGGVLMATWTKVTCGVLAAAAAVAVWMAWPDASAPAIAPSAANETAVVATAASSEPASAAADAAPRTDAAPERGVAPVPVANDPKLATIRGRCVDQNDAPIAGCKVGLGGWQANQERVDAWLRDHPQPDWQRPAEQVTAADGVFAFTFWPPPPFQFALEIGGGDLAAVGARWTEIAEGRTIELGDVVMVRGVMVQGRVVDDAGAPIANASVRVGLGSGESGGETATPTFRPVYGSTGGDGAFRCRSAVRPGPGEVYASGPDGRELPKPLAVSLTRERPAEDVLIVLPRPADGSTITGRVVDEAGQPIRAVSLEARDPETGSCGSTSTKRDGTFALKKIVADRAGSVFLHGTHALFEPVRSERTCEWGSRDVVLTMRAAGGLAVYVRDEDGAPVTDFTVRVVKRDSNGRSTNASDVRARGPYESGFAAVAGIQRGSWTLLVEFPTALRRAMVAMAIEKTTNDTLRVDVVARADAQRTIRVVDAKDEPVAGARVQLCLPVEGEFGGDTYISAMDRLFGPWSSVPMSRALLLMEGPTGADGAVVVTGPRHQKLGVRVRGPQHVPLHRGGVLLDDDAPLVLTVEQGARLHGALRPVGAIATLQRLAGQSGIEMRLERQADPYPRRLPMWFDPGLAIAADGSFDVAGLEPGEWKVVLQAGSTLELGGVTLRSGEATRLDPDLGYLQTGTLRGTLLENGSLLANTDLQVCGEVAGPFAYNSATTDATGRFDVQVGAGNYLVVLNRRASGDHWLALHSLERASVVVGQTTEQQFHVWSGQLKITVRDASGAVVPKLRIRVARPGRNDWVWLEPTDANGATEGELDAGDVTFATLPKRLQSPQAQRDAQSAGVAAGIADPITPLFMTFGTATVVAGKPTVVELRLPPEWDTR